ncbi:VPLPA-CTERM sorting domain-containing protein [uncultured Jannaschia sp.]|uniref:VPLPA-CTERM sorting domain-containing protein n=1 Tax=uncultured Jannaschia sp. TaxID=293347 RepID=UPI00262248E2|nr:VPLPA-CTERM sorting domain-containing protein [uncultured Jannaschia sp.]
MILRTTLTAVAALSIAGSASATTFSYDLVLNPLNNSGVTGSGSFVIDTTANTLTANVRASGLEPNMMHEQHIHGRSENGSPIDSNSPDLSDDADGDGFVELAEGQTQYGPILVELEDTMGNYPTAPDGSFDFSRIFDLADEETFAGDFGITDLLGSGDRPALELREVVIHGLTLEEGQGANGGEADGTAGYKGFLPVASGEITVAESLSPAPVPLPAAGWLMLAGFGGLGALRARRKSAKT